MRRKKHKQVRRALRFYKIQHGFRAPFKVLADGNFINAVSVLRCVGRVVLSMHEPSTCICDTRPDGLRIARQSPGDAMTPSLVLHRDGDPTELLSELLGDKVRVFTTPCVMHEVRKMGSELSKARDACRRLALHHCGHEETTKLPAAECLAHQIGETGRGNPLESEAYEEGIGVSQ